MTGGIAEIRSILDRRAKALHAKDVAALMLLVGLAWHHLRPRPVRRPRMAC